MNVARFAAIIAGLVVSGAVHGEANSEIRGRILDRVACEVEPSQAYVLYLPSNYTRERPWPVIFCFDAAARGRIPVERLQPAAEKYGYIVAASLNSRNGPGAENAAAIRSMTKDVSAHFSVDSRRIYSAGVSGGARVATAMALSGAAKGVIACSAGFPNSEGEIPTNVPFVFFGTAGTEDFNFGEMMRLDRDLEERRAIHRIVVFEGNHAWAPVELMTEAVEWLELQAIRTGARPMDEALIHELWHKRVTRFPLQRSAERWRALEAAVRDFEGLADVAIYAAEAKELRTSREVTSTLKSERRLAAREQELMKELDDAAQDSTGSKGRLTAEIRAKADSPTASPERQMFRRVIAAFASMTRESLPGLLEKTQYEEAARLLEMSLALRPADSRTLWELARARARQGDKKRMLVALRNAIVAGFNDSAQVESDTAFTKWRSDADFAAVVSMIGAGPSEIVELPTLRVTAALGSIELRQFYIPNAGDASPALSFLRVESVPPGSVGSLSGVQSGMEITSIEGVQVRGLSEEELADLLERPVKKEVVLTIRDRHQGLERTIHILIPSRHAPGGFEQTKTVP